MAKDIQWDSELTPEEQAALDSDECGQMELSRFYQKLIANVIIQQNELNALKALCAKHGSFACGGVTEVKPGEKTNEGTPLQFTYDGQKKTVTIPRGADCTSRAPGITGMTKQVEAAVGHNVYLIKYGTDSAIPFTAVKGDKGATGAADNGTEYYDNGAVKRKNSVTGVSMTGPGLFSASFTGLSVSAKVVTVSISGLNVSTDALFNASQVKFAKAFGTTSNHGAYEAKASG